jgi:predicted nuclease with RNAse H fold
LAAQKVPFFTQHFRQFEMSLFHNSFRRKMFCLLPGNQVEALVGVSLRGEKVNEHFSVHVVEGVDVHPEGVGHARHVQPERLKQRQKINVLA